MNFTNSSGSRNAVSAPEGSAETLELGGWPEPSPDWSDRAVNHWPWKLHVYGFATAFLLFSVNAVFVVLRCWKPGRKLHVRVLSLELTFASFARAFVLMLDPYGSAESHSAALSMFALILWGLSTACLISAFGILLLILLDTTQTSLGPPRLQKLTPLLTVTALNCTVFTTTHVAAFFVEYAATVVFACRLLFVLWGLSFCLGYAVTCCRIWQNVAASRTSAFTVADLGQETARLRKIHRLMCVASLVGAVMLGLSLHVAFHDFLVGSSSVVMHFWPWFATETALRLLELTVMFLIFGIVNKTRVRVADGEVQHSSNVIPMENVVVTNLSP